MGMLFIYIDTLVAAGTNASATAVAVDRFPPPFMVVALPGKGWRGAPVVETGPDGRATVGVNPLDTSLGLANWELL
jgi:hypothetical protein